MAKAFLVSTISNGIPNFSDLPHTGNVLCAKTPGGGYGIYVVTGTGAQLVAINALPHVIGLCSVTEGGGDGRWPELEDVILPAVRTKLNTWLTARGYPNIPAGWTYRHVIREICQRLNEFYEIENTDVLE